VRALKFVVVLGTLLAVAPAAQALEKHQWCFRKYGGGYGPPGNYCTPYRGWFGSPYYGGCNHAHWNRYGWGYDGLATHGH
jgi:hypothetical protein